MFMPIFLSLLLIGLGSLIVAGVIFGYRALNVVSKNSKISSLKNDIEIDRLQHNRRIADHGNQKQYLELTSAPEEDRQPAEPGGLATVVETMKVRDQDVQHPDEGLEGMKHRIDAYRAEDAEYVAI